MTTATIKLYLPYGDPKRLRTAEISNWTGKAIVAPRTDLDELLKRPEAGQPGVYILTGRDPDTGDALAYIGEAETIRERLKHHISKEFWVQAFVFVSKDENLTKSHIRYLEGRLIAEAQKVGRAELGNKQTSGAKLPESDTADMEVFLSRIGQLLPVLGSDVLTPLHKGAPSGPQEEETLPVLHHTIKGLTATGTRTPDGFVVFAGSQAVLEDLPSAAVSHGFILKERARLREAGILAPEGDHLILTRDVEFSSPSTAAGVLRGGSANGLILWKDESGQTLKQIESK